MDSGSAVDRRTSVRRALLAATKIRAIRPQCLVSRLIEPEDQELLPAGLREGAQTLVLNRFEDPGNRRSALSTGRMAAAIWSMCV